ncbi:MAG: hypothetical protein N3D20_00845 [Candidatus Pacearchaeota archaeon]|nr:hypothetical protein [Candidatus Pacearchaeota archaeon]
MIITPNIENAKNLIKKEKKPIIIKAQDDNFNRKILEYGKFDVLLSLELGKRKDSLKQMDSGLNHVLAKIAAKNHIAIGIDINEINNLKNKEKATILGRIIQNIKICRKSKTKLKLFNYKDKRNAFSLLLSLGASTPQAKEALDF